MARTPLPHHRSKFLHLTPQNLQPRNKPLPVTRRPSPTQVSTAQIRRPLSANIGPSRAAATFTHRDQVLARVPKHGSYISTARPPPFEGRAVEIDGEGNCFARAVARALGLPSYQDMKERTKTSSSGCQRSVKQQRVNQTQTFIQNILC